MALVESGESGKELGRAFFVDNYLEHWAISTVEDIVDMVEKPKQVTVVGGSDRLDIGKLERCAGYVRRELGFVGLRIPVEVSLNGVRKGYVMDLPRYMQEIIWG